MFFNLLNNAAEYTTDPGGRITLDAQCIGQEAVVTVSDAGFGIAPTALDRVFDLCAGVSTASRRDQDGPGIGLSRVRTLGTMHAGRIVAQSEGQGQGSRIVGRMPLAQELSNEKTGEPEYADQQLASSRSARRVLAVDDNKDSADSLAMVLRFLGAEVQTAYGGRSALEAVRSFQPSIVLMDLGMPDMDGCEVARRLRQDPASRGLLLIAMTGWAQDEDRRRSREAGFDDHLVKPVDSVALRALLASYDIRLGSRSGQASGTDSPSPGSDAR